MLVFLNTKGQKIVNNLMIDNFLEPSCTRCDPKSPAASGRWKWPSARSVGGGRHAGHRRVHEDGNPDHCAPASGVVTEILIAEGEPVADDQVVVHLD
jgi:hypothetical protein